MKHSLLKLRLYLTGIAILLCTSLALAQDKEPYVRVTGSGNDKTITFYYGMRPSDALYLAESYSSWNDTRAWKDELANIQTVVFDPSFAEYRPTSTSYWFKEMHNLTAIEGIENLNTSNVTSMSYMFFGCSSLTNLDLSSFDTSNVTNMGFMFYSCSGLTSLDVSNFDTSNVTDMSSMFSGCSSLTSLDVTNFDTSNVTYMNWMFFGCSSLTSLDVSNFNTSNVTDMNSMISNCFSLTSLDLSNFDTSNVTNMNSMFLCDSLFTSLNISSFNTSNVTDMSCVFYGCFALTSLDLSNFDTSNVTNMSFMFNGCSSLTSIDLSNFDTSNVTDMSSMFSGCSSLTSLDVTNFDTSNVTYMSWMFFGCSSLTSLDVSNFNTSNVTDMNSMLRNCFSLTSLDLSNFDTSNVTNMGLMFSGSLGLTNLDLSSFNTSNVTKMSDMFWKCSGLTSLDLSNFDTSNVTNMLYMFSGCSSLISLDLISFNTSNVTDMRNMFQNCSSLITIYVGEDWSTDMLNNGSSMFDGCTNLVGGKSTVFDESHTDGAYAHIDGGADNPGYFTAVGEVPLLLGDANCDGAVDVVDVTTVVDFILGKAQPTEEQRANADVNRDNSVDVVDLTSIVSIILGTYNYDDTAAGVKALTSSDVLVMDNVKCTMDNGVADIALMNSRDYVGFQMDVTLADGAVLNGVRLSNRAADHSVTYSRIADNTYRIVAYSLSGAPFSGVNGSLLTLDIEGIGQLDNLQLKIENALFSDGANGYTLGFDAATGIAGMDNEQMTNVELQMTNAGAVYDLSGKRVGHSASDILHSSRKGLYIVNGKTVLVK